MVTYILCLAELVSHNRFVPVVLLLLLLRDTQKVLRIVGSA